MNEWNVRILSTDSVSNSNFKHTLITATNTEIKRAICLMENATTGNHKSRILECKRELKKRERKIK